MSSIWETLSTIDCNEHIEKKGQFSYLAWTWAWAKVKENYPEAIYTLREDIVYPDGTMEVRVNVSINNLAHTMWLPVLNHQNKPIANPNAFDINSARMRCLVKCLAMFGLGHYIYAGESLPHAPLHSYTGDQEHTFREFVAGADDPLGYLDFLLGLSEEAKTDLFNCGEKGQKTALKNAAREFERQAFVMLTEYEDQIIEALEKGDPAAAALLAEVKESGKEILKLLWKRFSADQQEQLLSFKEAA